MDSERFLVTLAPFFDRFHKPSGLTEIALYKTRFFIAVLLGILLYLLSMLAALPHLHLLESGRILLKDFCLYGSAGIVASLAALRLTGYLSLCLNLFIFSITAALIKVNQELGGIYSPALPAFLFIPPLATAILGLRAGMFWFLAMASSTTAFYLLDINGFDYPSLMDEARISLGITLSLISTTLALSLVVLFYEYSAQKLNERLQAEHENTLFQATHDNLTGIANRKHFIDLINHAIDDSESGEGFAVLFFDLNRFKQANDTYGHQFGDELLIEVARRLKNSSRGSDAIARWGGDEFAMLLADANDENVINQRVAQLRDVIQKPIYVKSHQMFYSIGSSIGFSIYPEHGKNPEALIHHADHQMYFQKKQGTELAALN